MAQATGKNLPSPRTSSQSTSGQTQNSFQDFFSQLATASGVGGSRGETSYVKLMDSIPTMSPEEIAAGIPVIDRQIDNTAQPEDRLAKADAANLLLFISWRTDGAKLLASEMDRLTSMLNDPSHLMSGPATLTLMSISESRPDLAIPILEAALKHPEVNNATSVGPGIALALFKIAPTNKQAVNDIVQYMRRPDLTDNQLIRTIVGMDSGPVLPDALTAQLVRCLDRPNEYVKIRALVGISRRSSPPGKDAARTRIQEMANDPRETAHVRRLAAEALEGPITEDPDTNS